MAVLERDIVLMSKTADGNQTIDFPLTRLQNIEDTADVKAAPVAGDYLPVVDQADGGQMKKTTIDALIECVANALTIVSKAQPVDQPAGRTWLQILD